MPSVTLDIPCIRDTQLDSGAPTADLSTATTITLGMDADGDKEHGIFSFDLSAIGAIPPGAITAASLRLFVESSVATPGTNLWRLMSLPPAWTELANWNTYDGSTVWTAAGGDVTATGANIVSSVIAASVGTIISIGVSTGLTAARAAGQTRADFLIRRSTESGNTLTWTVSSRNHATEAQRPVLRITHTYPYSTVIGGFGGTERAKQRIRRW